MGGGAGLKKVVSTSLPPGAASRDPAWRGRDPARPSLVAAVPPPAGIGAAPVCSPTKSRAPRRLLRDSWGGRESFDPSGAPVQAFHLHHYLYGRLSAAGGRGLDEAAPSSQPSLEQTPPPVHNHCFRWPLPASISGPPPQWCRHSALHCLTMSTWSLSLYKLAATPWCCPTRRVKLDLRGHHVTTLTSQKSTDDFSALIKAPGQHGSMLVLHAKTTPRDLHESLPPSPLGSFLTRWPRYEPHRRDK